MVDDKIKLSQDEINTLLNKVTSSLDEKALDYLEDYKKGIIDFNKLMQGLSKVYKAETEVIKTKLNQEKEILLVQKSRQQYLKKIAENELKQSQSFWQRTTNFLSGQNNSEDAYQRMWRVRQRFGGLEQLFSGNVTSGLSQFLGSFQSVSKIMGGPYYLAIQTVITGLLKFDNALAKASERASSITGGLRSEYVGRGFASMAYNADLKNNLYAIGMQGKRDELVSALQKGYGYGVYSGQQSDFLTSIAYAQKGLGSLGISAETSNSLLERLRLIEGKDTTGIYAQLQRFINRAVGDKPMKYFSPDQAISQMMTLADQTKGLGTNFEWASRIVKSFEKGLKDGTLALSDFAAINRSLRGGNISANAGIAALVSDYALRTGINLPSSFTNSDILGQSFAVSTQAMLSNNQFARAYQGQIQEMLDQMGGGTREDIAGRLQTILQSRNINISSEAALNAIRSDGSIDLINSGIIGSKMGQRLKEEQDAADAYKKDVESYYQGTTSWHRQVLADLSQLVSNTGGSIASSLDTSRSHANDQWTLGRALAAIVSLGGSEAVAYQDRKIAKIKAEINIGAPDQTP